MFLALCFLLGDSRRLLPGRGAHAARAGGAVRLRLQQPEQHPRQPGDHGHDALLAPEAAGHRLPRRDRPSSSTPSSSPRRGASSTPRCRAPSARRPTTPATQPRRPRAPPRPRRAADLLEGHQGRVEGRLGRHVVRPGRALGHALRARPAAAHHAPRSPATSTRRQQRHGRSHHRGPDRGRPPSSCTNERSTAPAKGLVPLMVLGILIAIVGQSISGARFGMAWAEGVVAQEVDHEGARSSTRSSSRSRCTTRPSPRWPSSSRWGSSLPWSMQRHLVNGVGCFAAGLFCGWVVLVHRLLPARS